MALIDSIDKAVRVQHSAVVNHVQRIRRRHPGATPAEIVAALEKKYVATVTSTGAAVGAVAAAPGVGSAVALALTVAESAAFLETTALFTLAVASAQRSWWGNSPGRVQAKAWLAAGFEVTDVDLAAMKVRFDRRNNLG